MINLREERLRRGLSAKALAAQIDVSEDVLLYAERGGRPQPANARRIADYFGIDVLAQWPLPDPAEKAA